MKSRFKLFPFAFALAITFVIYACNKTENIIIPPDPLVCNLSISEFSVQLPCTVIYSAVKTGNVNVSNLTYRNDGGLQSINNPVLPFIDTLVLNVQNTVSMSVQSVATGGSIEIKFHARSGGTTYDANQSCGN
jgi:hypothetical protein